MTNKELDKITSPLRDKEVVHLLLARVRGGISLSSMADGDDLYEFFQVMADQNPIVLEIMQAVVESRQKPERPKTMPLLN